MGKLLASIYKGIRLQSLIVGFLRRIDNTNEQQDEKIDQLSKELKELKTYIMENDNK